MKKKKFFILPILYCCIAVQAQTSSKNYLLEKQMLDVSDNQIQSISDKAGSLLYDGSFDFKDGASESTEYFYNANGALTKDLNKGISKIEYDVLDNLSSITFNNGFKTKYVYDAGGSKLKTIHEALTTNTTDYIGDFIFEDGKLSKYQFEGGYCSFDSNLNPTYHYYEKDHLGSIRMVVNENGTIEQVNHYYPFGGVYGDLAYNSELQKNKYIGKEFDHTSGLDWYDHGARMYDAAKGSWDRMDALHSNHYNFNPYSYSGNNPILFVDKDGLDWYRENGIYMYSPDIHSGKDLKKDQTYMGKSFSIGNGNNKANYQKDGSVLFANETRAYNYIWKVANHHKREVGGFLLNDNNVLVMPEYKNDASTTKLDEYGYSFKGRSLSNSSGTTYNVKAQIHSHQDRYGSPEPSYTGGSTYYGVGGLSMYHKALPIFVMGHNDILYVIRGIRKKDAPHFHWTDWGKQSRTSLLNGKIKLSKEINILNNIKL